MNTSNDFPNGKTTRYTYASGFNDARLNRALLTITEPNEVNAGGPPQVIFTYGTNPSLASFARVTSQMVGGINANGVPAGGTITYQYQVLGTAGPNDFTTAVFQGAQPTFLRSRNLSGERSLQQEIRLSASYLRDSHRTASFAQCYIAGIDRGDVAAAISAEFGSPVTTVALRDFVEQAPDLGGYDAELMVAAGVFTG